MLKRYFILLLFFFILIPEIFSQNLRTVNYQGKSYFVYPYRIPQNTYANNVPPYLGKLPDGDYVAYYSYNYYYQFSIWKMGQKEKNEDSTKIAVLFQLKDQKKNGSWQVFFKSGKLRTSGFYENDLKTGLWKHYRADKKQTISYTVNYKNGLKNGEYIDYYLNGKITFKEEFKDDQLTGNYAYYYDNGQLFYQAEIKDSWQDTATFFNTKYSGFEIPECYKLLQPNTFFTSSYSSKKHHGNKILHGNIPVYYKNGQMAFIAQMYYGNLIWIDTIKNIDGKIIATFSKDDPAKDFRETIVTYTYQNNQKYLVDRYYADGSKEKITIINKDTYAVRTFPFNVGLNNLVLKRIEKKPNSSSEYYHHKKTGTTFKVEQFPTFKSYFKNIQYDSINDQWSWIDVDSSFMNRTRIEFFKHHNFSKKSVKYNYFWRYGYDFRLFIDNQPANGHFTLQRPDKKNNVFSFKRKNNTTYFYSFLTTETCSGNFKNGYPDGLWMVNSIAKLPDVYSFKEGRLDGLQLEYSLIVLKGEKRKQAADCGIKTKKHTYLQTIRNFKSNEKHGDQVSFNYLGNILSFIQYQNGQHHGRYEMFDEDGRPEIITQYEDGKLQGNYLEIKYDYSNGYYYQRSKRKIKTKESPVTQDILLKTFFNQGFMHGDFVYYNENKLTVKGQCENGTPVGVWNYFPFPTEVPGFTFTYYDTTTFKVFFENHSIKNNLYSVVLKEYSNFLAYTINNRHTGLRNQLLRSGILTTYYLNGDTCFTGAYDLNANHIGQWWIYQENNQRVKSIDFENKKWLYLGDTLDTYGTYTTYYPDGKKQIEGIILSVDYVYDCVSFQNIPTPKFIHKNVWNEKGEQILKDGNGKVYEKNEKGILIAEGEMQNYQREGLWKYYNEAGSLVEIGYFVNGKKDGKWLFGDLTGLNLDGLNCFDLNDPAILSQIEYQKKMVFLKESIYIMGKLINENSFNLNLNKTYRY